jgi:hypothetical protein
LALLAASGCTSIKIKSTKFCAVKGVVRAGAFCDETLNKAPTEMTMNEFFDFLEASPEVKDDKGKVIKKAKGAAVCQSSSDFTENKTKLEQACYLLGDLCDYELQEKIKKFDANFNALQSRSMAAKKAAK